MVPVQDNVGASTWVLACLLRLWSRPGAASSPAGQRGSPEHATATLDSMAPVYASMRRVGGSPAAAEAGNHIMAQAQLLEGTMQSEFRYASVAADAIRLCRVGQLWTGQAVWPIMGAW